MNVITRRFGLGYLAALLATLLMLGCAATPDHGSTGNMIDDAAITTKVKAAILDTSGLKSTEIKVETFKGVVQLSGFVDSAGEKAKAGDVTRSVAGVASVKNDLQLKPM